MNIQSHEPYFHWSDFFLYCSCNIFYDIISLWYCKYWEQPIYPSKLTCQKFVFFFFYLHDCPGFGWARVIFSPEARRGHSQVADPNWPNKQSIWYYVPSGLVGTGATGWGEVNHGSGVHWASGGERVALCIPLFCIFFLSVFLLLLFTSFAVLLNCPYPSPWVLPFSSDSPSHPSEERGARVATWFFAAGRG